MAAAFLSPLPLGTPRFSTQPLLTSKSHGHVLALRRRATFLRASLQLPPSTPPTATSASKLRRSLAVVTPVLLAVCKAAPVFALAASMVNRGGDGFISGLTAAFVLVLASEIGDKTFFISALLSMKYSRALVLLGTMAALGGMTVISVAIGQVFHALPSSLNSAIPFDDYAAIALLLWFGFRNIQDGLRMKPDEDDELQDAKDVVAGKRQVRGMRVVAETSSVIFFAEWGDKSMLATVALAAAKSPWGVILGGISGHFVASAIAVMGGSFLGRFISERSARLVGGVLFLVFAVLTLFAVW